MRCLQEYCFDCLIISCCAVQVYEDGSIYEPKILDLTDDDLGDVITAGLRNVAAACLTLDFPTIASVPHSLINGYKNVLAVAVETDYTFPLAEKVKAFLADPSAFAVAAPAGGAGDAAAAEAKVRHLRAAGFRCIV